MKRHINATPATPVPHAIAKAITRAALACLFFAVFFLAVLVSPAINGSVLFASLLKALLAVGLGWLFFLIVSDALVRSITASAVDTRASRRDGGLLYHFLPPDPDEIFDEDSSETPADKKK